MWTILAEAFVFGTVWFWMVIVAAFVLITILEECEKGAIAFAALVATVALLNVSSPIFTTLLHNPKRTILLVIAYFVVGTVWGFIKWFLFVTRQLEKYNEAKANFLRSNNATVLTPKLAKDLKKYITEDLYGEYSIEVNPQVRAHKSDVMRWMTYWPFSGLWTLINDPVRRAFRWIYARMQGTMQAVSDRVFRKANEDMKLAEEELSTKDVR